MYIGSKVVVVFNLNLQPRRPVAEQFSRFKIINIDFLTFSIKKSKMAKREIGSGEINMCLTLLLNE